jgi:hypothetical protein
VSTETQAPVEERPGWGKGDENHEHTGPPGSNGNEKEKEKK